jgi:hypothetical protein
MIPKITNHKDYNGNIIDDYVDIFLPHDCILTIYGEMTFVSTYWNTTGSIYNGVSKDSVFYKEVNKMIREKKLERILKNEK